MPRLRRSVGFVAANSMFQPVRHTTGQHGDVAKNTDVCRRRAYDVVFRCAFLQNLPLSASIRLFRQSGCAPLRNQVADVKNVRGHHVTNDKHNHDVCVFRQTCRTKLGHHRHGCIQRNDYRVFLQRARQTLRVSPESIQVCLILYVRSQTRRFGEKV